MLDQKVAKLLNDQITKEFYSAYLYLDFSNFYYDRGLDGFGNWYKVQAQEERDHAMLFIQYLQNNGEKAVLDTIDKPGVVPVSYTHLGAGLAGPHQPWEAGTYFHD